MKPIPEKLIPLMTLGLIVLAFIAGMFYGKLRVYQQQGIILGQKKDDSALPESNNQPAETEELTDDLWQEIIKDPLASKGETTAPVTIVEFSEYLCPFCAEYVGVNAIPSRPLDEDKTYQKIVENYVNQGKVRYIFRDFPVHGEVAMDIAAGAYCAGKQGKYWDFHDFLFDHQSDLSAATEVATLLKNLAINAGLNGGEFSRCLDQEEFASEVNKNYTLGQKVGVTGTPTFFINGQKIVGAQSFPTFQTIIDAKLQE